MTEAMDLARFERLVAAYGATPARWPEGERMAAQALLRSDPRAAFMLADADAIDALLFSHHAPEPSPALRALVIESAPRRRRLGGRARLWWSGIALALAAGSGALAGSAATAALDPTIANAPLYGHDYLPAYGDTSEENAQ